MREADTDEPVLHGVRVLDFGRYIAAPFCAALLADLGADVIRVEPPEGASDRSVMPLREGDDGALYAQMNRGKRSFTAAFRAIGDDPALVELVKGADVVVVNMPPAQLKRAGLDYDAVRALRPDIILTSITAYSTSGNARDLTGFDGTGQALSGAMYITGDGRVPTRAAVSYVDYSCGITAAYATLAALIGRMRSGRGQHVQTSLMQSALAIMNPILIEAATDTRHRTATGNRSPISGPSDAFETRDGWIMVQVIGDAMFARLARVIGQPELLERHEYVSDILRGENGAALSSILQRWCTDRTSAQAMDAFAEARLPCVPILTPAQALDAVGSRGDDHFARTGTNGLPVVAPMANLAGVGAIRAAPRLGEHDAEILRELGMYRDRETGPDGNGHEPTTKRKQQ